MLWLFLFQLFVNGVLALDIIQPYKKPGQTLQLENLTLQFFEEFDGVRDNPTGCGFELTHWKKKEILTGSFGKETLNKCNSLQQRLVEVGWKAAKSRTISSNKFEKQDLSYSRSFQYVPCQATLVGKLKPSPQPSEINLQTKHRDKTVAKSFKVAIPPEKTKHFAKQKLPIEFEGVIHFLMDRPQKVDYYFREVSLGDPNPSQDITEMFNSKVEVHDDADISLLKSRLRSKDAELIEATIVGRK